MTARATGNSLADYHPLGLAYGTNSTYELQNTAYANYNGLQVSWVKTTGRLTFNLNGAWSKALGTTVQQDPYTESRQLCTDGAGPAFDLQLVLHLQQRHAPYREPAW